MSPFAETTVTGWSACAATWLASPSPHCGQQMEMIATNVRADVVHAMLAARGLPTDAPFIRPCSGPLTGDLFEDWWK